MVYGAILRNGGVSSRTTCAILAVWMLVEYATTAAGANNTAVLGSQWSTTTAGRDLTILQSPNNTFSLNLVLATPGSCVASVQHVASGFQVWSANFYNTSTTASAATNLVTNCTLALGRDGNLALLENGIATWSSNTKSKSRAAAMALLESGNLVLGPIKDPTANNSVWQSFDNPTDTLITGQKLKFGTAMYAAMKDRPYTSAGVYSMRVVNYTHDLSLFADFTKPFDYRLPLPDYNQTFGAAIYWTLNTAYQPIFNAWVPGGGSYAALSDGLGVYDETGNLDIAVPTNNLNPNLTFLEYARLQPDGNLESFVFREGKWKRNFQAVAAPCRLPGTCGPYGICTAVSSSTTVQCTGCPPGFRALNGSDPSQGCAVIAPLAGTCGAGGGRETRAIEFVNITGYTYFAIADSYSGGSLASVYPHEIVSSAAECEAMCRRNCSCAAAVHAMVDFKSTEACFLLPSLQTIEAGATNNGTIFFKLAKGSPLFVAPAPAPNSPLPATSPAAGSAPGDPGPTSGAGVGVSKSHGSKRVVIAVAAAAGGVLVCVLLVSAVLCLCISRKRLEAQTADDEVFLDTLLGLPPRFSYKDLTIATNNFSKKLGAGGFGSVYEGVLADNKTKVAVKELEAMGQGTKEFRAEVATIGSISHVNLVPLRGFCMEGQHRLLVYEFVPNGSLDRFLFKRKESTPFLDLRTRQAIAVGTARGLAYLHDECTSRIIHCDVKPENILLDEGLAPRVADFGLAKLMHRDQSYMVTTMRGTRGYMAPEWLKNTPITEKGDVYSFGVVLLELLAGRRNFDTSAGSEDKWFLPTWAFSLLEQEDQDLEGGHHGLLALVDPHLEAVDKMTAAEQRTCRNMVRVALWCIQEDPALRPAMADVGKMLDADDVPRPPLSHALFGDDLAAPYLSSSSQSSVPLKHTTDFLSTQGSQITQVLPR